MSRILSSNEHTSYLSDLEAFLEGRQNGILDKWSYVNDDKWENLVRAATNQNSSYYLTQVEQPVLFKRAGDISDHVEQCGGVSTLFVRGTGTGEKIVPLVGALNGKLQHVLLFDLSEEFTTKAREHIEHFRPDLTITEINFDFEAPGNGTRSNQNAFGMELGGTLFNISGPDFNQFPKDELKRRLTKFSSQFGKNTRNWALVTQHINPDSAAVIASYNDGPNHDFAINALELASQLPGTEEGLNLKDLFEHVPTCIDLGNGDRVIAHMAQPKFTGTREVTIGGKEFSLSDTFRNSTINSYLPSEQTFKTCAEDVGFVIHQTYYDEDKKIAIHLMEFDTRENVPEHEKNCDRCKPGQFKM